MLQQQQSQERKRINCLVLFVKKLAFFVSLLACRIVVPASPLKNRNLAFNLLSAIVSDQS